jgi:cytochrome c553
VHGPVGTAAAIIAPNTAARPKQAVGTLDNACPFGGSMTRWEARPYRRGAIGLALAAWALASCAQSTALDAKAIERGARLIGFCANCHGANGNSTAPEIPNLAGQNAAYLEEQMRRFVDGRRKDPFMAGLIKAMNATERADAIAYLSAQTMQPSVPRAPAAQIAEGQSYFGKVCFRCHGEKAMGDASVPRLAGQQPGYVVKSLKRYRDGTGERLEPVMAANTKLMTDAQIQAVAAYLASLR